ncbi:MAG: hypothetical protein AB1416_11565 [Actinomycetota bacterium]
MSKDSRGPEPAVYARLNAEAEVRLVRRTPHRAARWIGMALVVAIAVGVALAVLWAGT